ncbi:MAG: choline dehydrogenase [Mesorhizobium sp.]|nr:choline dehydrogenase [Mesorhizobium sp.]
MYDYIIVGAGSAGCVLANRLSRDGTKRVCLIEAGPPDTSPFIHMPMGMAAIARNRKINWAYLTEPQQALGGRRLYWPRGRTLGGSSSINAMIYMRGHKADYEGWAEVAGDAWAWEHVRRLFIAMENNCDIHDGHHGTEGELAVANLRHANPLSHAFVEAAAQLQYSRNADFNGERQEGFGLFQVTQRDGRRFSSARAFLEPALARPNLEVRTGALVQRVLFAGRQASGVALAGGELMLNAGGEVILSGGAINSPQLLMLSGIGPGAELQRHGIGVLHDLPEVGENLQDHLDLTLMAAASTRDAIALSLASLPRAFRAYRAFARDGTGEFTSNIAEAGGFVRSSPERDRPNVQFHFIPAYLRDHGRQISFGYGYTLHVCDLLPESRGRIRLASPDPSVHPSIEPDYLSDPRDVDTMLKAVRIGRAIMDAPALAAHRKAELHPGPNVRSDGELIADMRARAETIYHPAGTCRMGRDAASVVEPQLRVRGVDGLRVVDASVMPRLIAGNTNAPTMMIAENAAAMMLAPAN